MFFAYLQLEKFPSNQVPRHSGNSQAGYQALESTFSSPDQEFIEAFVEFLWRESNAKLLFSILDARGKVDPLIVACLRASIGLPQAHELFGQELIRRWNFLKSHLDSSPDDTYFTKMLRSALDNTSLGEKLQQADGGFSRAKASMYSDAINIEGSTAAAGVAAWCSDNLSSTATDQWTADFAESFALAELSLLVSARGVAPTLSLSFIDAIEGHAANVCRGQQLPPGGLASRWGHLLACIKEESLRSNLRLKLLRVAADHGDGRLQDSFFDLYGAFLMEGMGSMSNFEPLFRLLIGMVKQRMPTRGLTWGARALEQNPSIRGHASTLDLHRELEMRVQQALDHEAHTEIAGIAKSLGVDINQ